MGLSAALGPEKWSLGGGISPRRAISLHWPPVFRGEFRKAREVTSLDRDVITHDILRTGTSSIQAGPLSVTCIAHDGLHCSEYAGRQVVSRLDAEGFRGYRVQGRLARWVTPPAP